MTYMVRRYAFGESGGRWGGSRTQLWELERSSNVTLPLLWERSFWLAGLMIFSLETESVGFTFGLSADMTVRLKHIVYHWEKAWINTVKVCLLPFITSFREPKSNLVHVHDFRLSVIEFVCPHRDSSRWERA